MKHYRIIQTKIDLNHHARWPQMLLQHIQSLCNRAAPLCEPQEPSHAGCPWRPHRLCASLAGEGRPAGRQGQEGQHGPAPGGRSCHMAAMNGNLYPPASVRLTNKAAAVLPNTQNDAVDLFYVFRKSRAKLFNMNNSAAAAVTPSQCDAFKL